MGGPWGLRGPDSQEGSLQQVQQQQQQQQQMLLQQQHMPHPGWYQQQHHGQYHQPFALQQSQQQQQQHQHQQQQEQRKQPLTLLEASVIDERMRGLLHAGGLWLSLDEQRKIVNNTNKCFLLAGCCGAAAAAAARRVTPIKGTQLLCFVAGCLGGLVFLSPLQRRRQWQQLIDTPGSKAGETAKLLLQQMRAAGIPLQQTPSLPLPSVVLLPPTARAAAAAPRVAPTVGYRTWDDILCEAWLPWPQQQQQQQVQQQQQQQEDSERQRQLE
ncbi:hypothetical protein Emag_000838 [Eimeria magna]